MPEQPQRRRLVLRATYNALLEAGEWRPLAGCPGRQVLPGAREATPEELVGRGTPIRRFEVPGAEDPVCVARVDGGGLISYAKPDGTYVHTLNTAEGFARKLAQLGIDLER